MKYGLYIGISSLPIHTARSKEELRAHIIITGVKGERYPCKPDIFEATYEPV